MMRKIKLDHPREPSAGDPAQRVRIWKVELGMQVKLIERYRTRYLGSFALVSERQKQAAYDQLQCIRMVLAGYEVLGAGPPGKKKS